MRPPRIARDPWMPAEGELMEGYLARLATGALHSRQARERLKATYGSTIYKLYQAHSAPPPDAHVH